MLYYKHKILNFSGTGEELLSPSLSIERLQQIELVQEIATSQKSQLRETEGLLKESVKGKINMLVTFEFNFQISIYMVGQTILVSHGYCPTDSRY